MMEKFTISEAAKFLGVDTSEIEDLVASGDINFEIENDQYLIPRYTLIKIKLEKYFQREASSPPSQTLLDDREFITFLRELAEYNTYQILHQLQELQTSSHRDVTKTGKIVVERIDTLQKSVNSIAHMELDKQAVENLEKIMSIAVSNALKNVEIKPSSSISEKDLKAISESISQVIDKKLTKHNEIIKALKILETRIVTGDEKILNSLKKIKVDIPIEDIRKKFETFAKFLNKNLSERMALLKKERREMAELIRAIEKSRTEIQKNPDISTILRSVQSLYEGQKRVKKLLEEINLNIQKTSEENIAQIKNITSNPPAFIEEIKDLLPYLRSLIENRLSKVDQITQAIESLKENFTIEGQGNLLARLEEVKKSIENSDVGKILPHLDERLKELRRSLEQIFVHLGGRQQKAFNEKLERLKVSKETLMYIQNQIKEMENYFGDLLEKQQKTHRSLEDILKRLESTESPQKASGNLDLEEINLKLHQIEESMENLYEKLDISTMMDALLESMDENLSGLRESQESFQKIIVNLNINNQKAIVEKLQQLDRLNELVAIHDNVDEIAEQMQSFEAIMADINQLVDERLQALATISEQISSLSSEGLGGSFSLQASKKIEEMRSIMDKLHDSFSVEGLLSHFKAMLDELSEEIKRHHDSAQKVLINLNVKTQKFLAESMEKMGENFDLLKETRDQFNLLETLIPSISDLIDVKLKHLEYLKEKTHGVSEMQEMVESLSRLQKLIEHETKSIRHSIESTQKVIVNLGNNNKKLLMERMSNVGLSEKAIEEITERNRKILESIIGHLEPNTTIISALENIALLLESLKENIDTEHMLEKIVEFMNYQTKDIKDSSKEDLESLSSLIHQIRQDIIQRIDQINAGISEVRATIDPENIVSSMGDVIIEGNEMLKENQVALLNHQMKSFKEIMDKLQSLSGIKGALSDGEVAGEILPMMAKLLENQMANFKKDLDGAHKVLVNLNVNLQKQMLSKIKELLENQDKYDQESLISAVDYLLDEKLSEIKENQEALLSVNLNTQKTLKEKLDQVIKMRTTGKNIPDGMESLLPAIEELLTEKINALWNSHIEAQEALKKMAEDHHRTVVGKLEQISKDIKEKGGVADIEEYLPAIRDAMEETYRYLNDFKGDLETLKKNIQLQDPRFLGAKLDELREFLKIASIPEDLIQKVQQAIDESLQDHRKNLSIIAQRIEEIAEYLGGLPLDSGAEVSKLKELFAKKVEETRQLEKQLIQSFKQMHTIFRKGYESDTLDRRGENIQEILQEIEDAKREQEMISTKVDRLLKLIEKVSHHGAATSKLDISRADEAIMEQLKRENSRMKKMLENLRKENYSLQKQIQSLRSGVGEYTEEQLKAMMAEKDRLLEECYREKVELREQLEKEKRDKYELIQKYEMEKKELIDSLALERIQREKERAELELLRSEAKKKKWW